MAVERLIWCERCSNRVMHPPRGGEFRLWCAGYLLGMYKCDRKRCRRFLERGELVWAITEGVTVQDCLHSPPHLTLDLDWVRELIEPLGWADPEVHGDIPL